VVTAEVPVEGIDRALTPLARSFYARATEVVARDLLGAMLCRKTADGLVVGRIVETEAYGGRADLASHARAGLTRRTAPMFGEVGHAYVYLIYGMHECLNVVAHEGEAEAGAVLLRAVEPVVGVDLVRSRRGRALDSDARLASGPARLTKAMAVDRSSNGHDLTSGDELWVSAADAEFTAVVAVGSRIGVEYAGEWAARPWRFWVSGHPSVSRR
jgi:DNA-3-methyladenine glycosylase